MMTGKPKTRLSERLNADLEQIRAEHTALMQLSLETFRHDLQTTAQDAQNTIETDIRSFLHWSGMAWSDQLMKIRRLIWLSPWMVMGMALVLIMSLLGLTFLWSWMMADLNRNWQMQVYGIQRIIHEGQTYLILDPTIAELRTCTLAGRSVTCLKVGE